MIRKPHKVILVLASVMTLVLTMVVGVPTAFAGEYLLDKPGDTQTVTGVVGGTAIFEFFNPGDPTGSGVFDPFVRIHSNVAVEKGYNTSYRKLEFDENNSPVFTKDYLLANVPVVEIGGVKYREFQCDVNQKNSANPNYYISLDKLEFYVTSQTKLHDYPFTGDATLVWQMKYGIDWIKINSLPNAGSGRRDFRVLVPDSIFVGGDHVVLFSEFGDKFANNGGYEEWGVRVGPGIDIKKYLSVNCGPWLDANDYVLVSASAQIKFKIVVTNAGSLSLTGIQLTDIFINQNSPGGSGTVIPLTLGSCPGSLKPGESFIVTSGTFTAGYCWHTNTASVSGMFDDMTASDSDVAKYKGG